MGHVGHLWTSLHICTVPLKCKLTVLMRYSILDPRSFRELRIEFRGSSFEVREPSFEDRVSSFKTLEEFFEDLEQRFRGNDLILENKTIAMNKTINARFYLRKPAVECTCMQIFFRVVHFLQDTCGSLIYTVADDSKLQLASKCVYNISCRNE